MNKIVERITKSKALLAVKDSFLSLNALTIVGSFFILATNIPYNPINDVLQNNFPVLFKTVLPHMADSFYLFISIYVVISISYFYSNSLGILPIQSALISFFVYLVLTPFNGVNTIYLSSDYSNSNGIFLAIIVGLIVPRLIKWLLKLNISVKLPNSVPKDVSDNFSSLIPLLCICFLLTAVNLTLTNILDTDIYAIFNTFIDKPLMLFGTNIVIIVLINFGISFFWFFGFNGSYIFNSVMKPIYISLSTQNLESISNGEVPKNIVTGTFQSIFINLGGCGSTLALIIAIFLVSRNAGIKKIAKIGLIPSLFNINEPIVYSIPIILNFKLFIPFVVCPVINTLISYFSMKWGLVNMTNGIQLPWTMPIFFSGFLGVGLSGVFLQLFLLSINTIIYLPFVRKMGKEEAQNENSLHNNSGL